MKLETTNATRLLFADSLAFKRAVVKKVVKDNKAAINPTSVSENPK
jgi:hypothetical protein